MVSENRKAYIDVVAGIMIIWMILGHCYSFSHYFPRVIWNTYKFLSFYMPWFFYKSGSFFRSRTSKDLLKKDLRKYIRPFLVYSIIGWSVWSVCGVIDGSRSLYSCLMAPLNSFYLRGNIKGNGALWFLLSLFLVRQIGNVCLNIQLKSSFKWIVVITVIIVISLAFLLYKIEWSNHSWWFGNIFTGLFFFLLGYLLNSIEQNRWAFLISTSIYALYVFLYFTCIINDFPYLYMHANRMYRGNYLLFFPMAVAGIIMTNNIFSFLCNRVKFRILEYIGRNSMNLYVTHWILFTIVVFVTKHISHIESTKYMFYILLMSSIVFLPLISKLIDTVKSKYKFFNKIL